MQTVWGNVAEFMLKKRLTDVHADPAHLTKDDLGRIVNLLREKTLPPTLGQEGAARKAALYMHWLKDVS